MGSRARAPSEVEVVAVPSGALLLADRSADDGFAPSAWRVHAGSLAASTARAEMAFLAHADGWDGLSSSADLYGTPDFMGSPRFRAAVERLRAVPDGALGRFARRRRDLVPISSKEGIPDVFAMLREGAHFRREVIWVSDAELIEEFASFGDAFLAFQALARRSIDRWSSRGGR